MNVLNSALLLGPDWPLTSVLQGLGLKVPLKFEITIFYSPHYTQSEFKKQSLIGVFILGNRIHCKR